MYSLFVVVSTIAMWCSWVGCGLWWLSQDAGWVGPKISMKDFCLKREGISDACNM